MRLFQLLAAATMLAYTATTAQAMDPYAGNDPFWILLHEPAVVAELKLSASQDSKYRELLDGLDLRFFPLRNQTYERANEGLKAILADGQGGLKSILEPPQLQRLNEILLQHLGNSSFLRADVIAELKLSNAQQTRMREIASTADKAVNDLSAKKDTNPQAMERQYVKIKTDEQKKLLAVLQPEQLTRFKARIGSPFPQGMLRKPAFKAPEIIDTDQWINSAAVSSAAMKGKVIAIHFYACGCINCIHNYPWYRQWHDQFKDKDFMLIGIHTPETNRERDVTFVRKKAEEENLKFPILIDGKQENWNAWGNSMWPSVYLIDKRGYMRDFWPGELNWQGNDGEKQMRLRIEELLAEPNEAAAIKNASR